MTTKTTKKAVKVDGTKVAETTKVEKVPTRAGLLQLLDGHGYTGPRSYTAAVLSGVVEWLDRKAPKDQTAGLPDGVVFARPATGTCREGAAPQQELPRRAGRRPQRARRGRGRARVRDCPTGVRRGRGVRLVGYLRTSTGHQPHSLDAQRGAIQREADHRGWAVSYIEDAAQSGRRDDRPGLMQALALLEDGEADGLVVAKLDRLGRSVAGLAHAIDHARDYGWSLIALDVGIDSTTSGGRLVLRMMSALAEWEAEQIRERTRDGLAAAKAKGIRPGPPPSAVGPVVVRIVAEHQPGATPSAIARDLTRDGVPLPSGRVGQWRGVQVRRVLDRTQA